MAANLNAAFLEGNAGTSLNVAITAGAAGGHTDDSAFTAGTDDVSVSGGFFNDSTPDSVDEGDAGALRMSANRVGYRTLRDAAGNERGANVNAANELTVSSIITGAALTALQLIDNPVAILGTAAYSETTTSGFVVGAVRNDVLDALADTDNEIAPLQVNPIGALYVTGDVAHDAVDSGNSIKGGAVAIAHGTNPTAVAAADRVDLLASRAGVPFVIGGHPNIVTTRTNFTGAEANTALITVADGLKIVVTRVSVLADNVNSVDVSALIGFAKVTTPTGVGVVLSHPGIAAGSGVVEGTGAGILGVGADGEDLRITSQVPTTGSIDVVTSHYTIES